MDNPPDLSAAQNFFQAYYGADDDFFTSTEKIIVEIRRLTESEDNRNFEALCEISKQLDEILKLDDQALMQLFDIPVVMSPVLQAQVEAGALSYDTPAWYRAWLQEVYANLKDFLPEC